MKKTEPIKKIRLSRETLARLQAEDLRDAMQGGSGGGCTGPSCDIFRVCTRGGVDC